MAGTVSCVEDVPQGRVQRHVDHAQPDAAADRLAGRQVQHHGELAHAAAFGQQFGVPRIAMTGGPQRGLVQRRGDDALDAIGECQVDGFINPFGW